MPKKPNTFGQRFHDLRIERELTQKKMADIFYLNTSSISKYEKNRSMPENALLIQFADFFQVSIDYLLCRTDCPQMVRSQDAIITNANQANTSLTPQDSEAIQAYLAMDEKKRQEIADFIVFKAKN